jgi:hypothetical protein
VEVFGPCLLHQTVGGVDERGACGVGHQASHPEAEEVHQLLPQVTARALGRSVHVRQRQPQVQVVAERRQLPHTPAKRDSIASQFSSTKQQPRASAPRNIKTRPLLSGMLI